MSEEQTKEEPRLEMMLKAVGWVRSTIKDPILRADGRSLELQAELEDARWVSREDVARAFAGDHPDILPAPFPRVGSRAPTLAGMVADPERESGEPERQEAPDEPSSDSGTTGSGSAERRRRIGMIAAIGAALVALGAAWVLASPVGAAADDSFHLASIWCAPTAPDDACTNVGDAFAAGKDFVEVPVEITFEAHCFAFDPLTSAACPVSESLVDQVLSYLPRLAAGGVLALFAWVLAMLLKKLAVRGLASTRLDEKVSREAGMKPVSDSLGDVVAVAEFTARISGAEAMWS